MAHGIVGLLDPQTDAAVRAMRTELEERFGLRRLRPIPIPHMTLLAFADFDEVLITALTPGPTNSLRADGWMLFAGCGAGSAPSTRRSCSLSSGEWTTPKAPTSTRSTSSTCATVAIGIVTS